MKTMNIKPEVNEVYSAEEIIINDINKLISYIDPIITLEDNSFSYSYGSINAVHHIPAYLICEGNENGTFRAQVDITDVTFDSAEECCPQLEIAHGIALGIIEDSKQYIDSDVCDGVEIFINPTIAMITEGDKIILDIDLEWCEVSKMKKWMK